MSTPFNSQSRGFTIIELLVVLGIWAALMGVVLFDYTKSAAQENLRSSAGELNLAFREAQIWGTSSRAFPSDSTDSDRFDRGFGVFVEKGSPHYYIYGGSGVNGHNPNNNRFNSANIVQQGTFPGGIKVESICMAAVGIPDDCISGNTDELHAHFRRPFLNAILLEENGAQRKLYAKVVLVDPRRPEFKKTVIIWSTGRFYTQD